MAGKHEAPAPRGRLVLSPGLTERERQRRLDVAVGILLQTRPWQERLTRLRADEPTAPPPAHTFTEEELRTRPRYRPFRRPSPGADGRPSGG